MKLYMRLAKMVDAYKRCIVSKSDQYGDWAVKHQQSIDELMELLPHGSGIDGDTKLEIDQCSPKQIVLASSFHVMDDNGMYAGWIDFKIKITASLMFGFDMQVNGNFGKHQDLKEYLLDIFGEAFDMEVSQ